LAKYVEKISTSRIPNAYNVKIILYDNSLMLILYYSFGASLVAIGSANAIYFERKKYLWLGVNSEMCVTVCVECIQWKI
jgi:hypothetical protein